MASPTPFYVPLRVFSMQCHTRLLNIPVLLEDLQAGNGNRPYPIFIRGRTMCETFLYTRKDRMTLTGKKKCEPEPEE